MTKYLIEQADLRSNRRTWLVTGVAGFIGSHLAETLLSLGQKVIGLDNLSSGHLANIKGFAANQSFSFIEGDIRDQETCLRACDGAQFVLHHAAIGSVVKSLEDPALVDQVNNGGFINILLAARAKGVKKVVYASSSAVYGDGNEMPRHESDALSPLSPYAVTKCANELYAGALLQDAGLEAIGLRYFNIYGARQDPAGAYAAVIPKWIGQMLSDDEIEIYGDGETMRDFCHVSDVVQANILAATASQKFGKPVYNIGAGSGTTLNQLFCHLKAYASYHHKPVYRDFRGADIRISCANISKARQEIGFEPQVSIDDGLAATMEHYKAGKNG